MTDWSDPYHDVIDDLIKFKNRAEQEYKQIIAVTGRQAGKTTAQRRWTEEMKKPSEFLGKKDEDTIHEAKLQILVGLQGKQMYQGSVDGEIVRRRRAKNKRARAARRVHRLRRK